MGDELVRVFQLKAVPFDSLERWLRRVDGQDTSSPASARTRSVVTVVAPSNGRALRRTVDGATRCPSEMLISASPQTVRKKSANVGKMPSPANVARIAEGQQI
jgi:hypothetical protein